MILDSSALLSILYRERGHERLVSAVANADLIWIGAPTMFESTMASTRVFGSRGSSFVAQFVERWRVAVTPFDAGQARVAIEAFHRFGKGRHSAALNFGDCMAYATSKVSGQPLLYVGNDFAQTDVESVF